MKHFAIYRISSGLITQRGTCANSLLPLQIPVDPALDLIELPERADKYWVDVTTDPHTLQEKIPYAIGSINKTTMLADGVDTCTITGLYNPTTVTWPDGVITEETGGEISFTLDLAGEYTVRLQAIPYLDGEIYVTATDPA